MSIVERAAELFGMPQAAARNAPAPAPGPEMSAVERAMKSALHAHRDAEPVHGGAVPDPVAPARTVHIDLAALAAKGMIVPDGGRTVITEGFRRIKRHLLANLTNPAGSVSNLVMVTSALPDEGKTFCAINLAMSLAMEVDRSVLLVDADIVRPSVTSELGVSTPDERGLMDVLTDPSVHLRDVLCATDVNKLTLLPSGNRHSRATEVLASEAMKRLLRQISEQDASRIVIFDSPPLLAASESCALASSMGQVVVIVEAGRTTEAALRDALASIASCNVAGVVLNKGALLGSDEYGSGGYAHGYGYGA